MAANVTRRRTSCIRGAGGVSAIEMTAQNLRISQVRAAAARTADAKQARRILALPWGWMGIRDSWPHTGRWRRASNAARLCASLQRRWVDSGCIISQTAAWHVGFASVSEICKDAAAASRASPWHAAVDRNLALRHRWHHSEHKSPTYYEASCNRGKILHELG
jgi:hypothetical protein